MCCVRTYLTPIHPSGKPRTPTKQVHQVPQRARGKPRTTLHTNNNQHDYYCVLPSSLVAVTGPGVSHASPRLVDLPAPSVHCGKLFTRNPLSVCSQGPLSTPGWVFWVHFFHACMCPLCGILAVSACKAPAKWPNMAIVMPSQAAGPLCQASRLPKMAVTRPNSPSDGRI